MTKQQKIEKLIEDVGKPKLIAAMVFVFQARRERSEFNVPDWRLENPEQVLDEFLQTSSSKQLKMLRQMTDELMGEIVEEMPGSEGLEVVTGVVEPPVKQ
jgi:hypothetical protein